MAIIILLLNDPKRVIRKKGGLDLEKDDCIIRFSTFFDGFCLCRAYDVLFDEDELEKIMRQLEYIVEGLDNTMDPAYIQSIADGDYGVPYKKHWLNPEKEMVLFCFDMINGTRMTVTQTDSGKYHLYIEWSNNPIEELYK